MKNIRTVLKSTLIAMLMMLLSLCFVACDEQDNENVWVAFNHSKITMVVEQTINLAIVFTPDDAIDKSYVISTNNSSVVSVNQNGTIKAMSAGVATITVTSNAGSHSANCVVTVLAQPITLASPTNIHFDGEKIVWDSVANKTGYKVKLNEEILTTTFGSEFFRNFEVGVENNISIQTVGNGKSTYDSIWSEVYTFKQLTAPSISIVEGNINFVSSSANPKYELYIDGVLIEGNIARSYYIIPTDLSVGTHIYKAKEIGNESNFIFTSSFSEEKSITKLVAPTNAVVSASVLTFDAVIGASGYTLQLNSKKDNSTTYIDCKTNTHYLGDEYFVGKYDIAIMSCGNWSIPTISSDYSTTFAVDKLDAPTELSITNGVLSWKQATSPRNSFLINIFNSPTNQLIQLIPTNQCFYNFAEHFKEAGQYSISIIATGDSDASQTIRYINSFESEPLTVTKLSTPTDARIYDNQYNWNSVVSSTKYEVLHGSSTTYSLTDNHFNFLDTEDVTFEAGSHTVCVRAIGNGSDVIDSEYSQQVTFTKLGTVDAEKFTISEAKVFWEGIENCLEYKVFINDNIPFNTNVCNIDMSGQEYSQIDYSVKIQALSKIENFVMGEKSQSFSFKKLATPTNLSVENGKLKWEMPDNTGIVSSYRIKVGDGNIKDTKSNAMTSDLHGNLEDGTTNLVSIQAICNDITNQFMWGNFSEPKQLTKLSSFFQAQITNSQFVWNRIESAHCYVISISYTIEDELHFETNEIFANEDRIINLLDLDCFDYATTYSINIQALGETGTNYISSKQSSNVVVDRLDKVSNLRIEKGIIVWDTVENVDHYEVVINSNISVNLENVSTYSLDKMYDAGEYTIKVLVHGDGIKTLDAEIPEETLAAIKLGDDFEISVATDKLVWNEIENSNMYSYVLSEGNNIIYSSDSLQNEYLNIANIEGGKTYYFSLRANGDDEQYLNGDYCTEFSAKILTRPSNLSIDNGILSWDYVADTSNYIIFVNESGTAIPYEKTDDNNRGSFDFANYVSTNNIVGDIRIVIQSVGGVGVDAFVSSAYSDEIRTCKLSAPILYNENGVLNWNHIKNARNYYVFVESGANTDMLILSNSDSFYELGSQFPDGEYSISIQTKGDEKKYLTSEKSAVFSATKLATPIAGSTDLRVSNGKIVWNNVENAYSYFINVYSRDNTSGLYSKFTSDEVRAQTSNSYSFFGDYGQYKIDIKVIGLSGSRYLNSNVYEYANVMTKLDKPTDMHVEMGKLKWSPIEGVTANGYNLNFNERPKNVGQVTSYSLDTAFAAIQYIVSINSQGDNVSKLTSDNSESIAIQKMPTQTLSIINNVLAWDAEYSCDYYDLDIYNLADEQNVINEQFDDKYVTDFSLNSYEAGYYVAKIRTVGGDFGQDELGYVTSDWSEEFYIYKIQIPQEFHLISDFESSDDDILEKLGTLTWENPDYATKYSIHSSSSEVSFSDDNITSNSYAFADDKLSIGTYSIKLIARNDSTIKYDGITYGVVKSDEAILNATKLATPNNLYTENGNLYWSNPNMGDDVSIDFKYILYWQYAEENTEFNQDLYDSRYINTGWSHEIGTSLETVILKSYPLWSLGKYKLMLRTVGENCIRSSTIACENYINYSSTLSTHCIFDLFYDGDGTDENPYIIKTFTKNNIQRTALSQLNYLNYLSTKSYKLQENIELSADFVAIGIKDSNSDIFTGKFDAIKPDNSGYCVIDASKVNYMSLGNIGLFYKIGEGAVVQNLIFRNINIKGTYNVIGCITSENAGTINNISISGTSKISSIHSSTNKMYVGGIAGINLSTGVISGCETTIVLQTQNIHDIIYAGGIAGYNEGVITKCRTNRATLLGETIIDQICGTMAGGIAGFNVGVSAVISECSNQAMVYAVFGGSESSGVSNGIAGGIVGKNSYQSSGAGGSVTEYPLVRNCYNSAVVKSFDSNNLTSSKAGGIVGYLSGGEIEYCYNSGSIYVIDTDRISNRYDYAGGIIGFNDSGNSVASYCYYKQESYSQTEMPDLTTSLNSTSTEINCVTEDYLKTNLISAKFALVEGQMQKLAWETI